MTALIRYDEMCRAIDAAYAVDEVKDIRDKARAIEVYSRQAKNVEAEGRACEIRLRAERKCGQLLREMQRSQGGRPTKNSPHDGVSFSTYRAKAGISKKQAENWQDLANVPEEAFEAALKKPGRPTTNGVIAAQAKPKPKSATSDEALWVWGRLRDFERDGLLDTDPNELVSGMLEHMQETTRRLAPRVAAWLGRIKP